MLVPMLDLNKIKLKNQHCSNPNDVETQYQETTKNSKLNTNGSLDILEEPQIAISKARKSFYRKKTNPTTQERSPKFLSP